MDYQIIYKYLHNEASEEEVETVFQWIEASDENRKEFIGLKKIFALTATSQENEDKAWKLFSLSQFGKHRSFRMYSRLAKYAATIALFFGLGMLFQYLDLGLNKKSFVFEKSTTVTAPLGQMTNIELPDGTKVMLNSGSVLSYNGNFLEGNRKVILKGEAYFDVAKDHKHYFMVETSSLNFRVYGTSFNISAYALEKEVNATLIEGSLGVINKADKELCKLVPGENAHYNNVTSKLLVNKVNTDLYTSWKEGLITFRNEKLKDIAKKIERWFNVSIIIKNQKLGEEAYFGAIMKNKPIDQILEVLKLTSSLHYKIVTSADKKTEIYWY